MRSAFLSVRAGCVEEIKKGRDWMRDFYIKQRGKETLFFASFDEMMECFDKMDECDKHFCTVHDDSTGRYAPGYDIVWAGANVNHAFKHIA